MLNLYRLLLLKLLLLLRLILLLLLHRLLLTILLLLQLYLYLLLYDVLLHFYFLTHLFVDVALGLLLQVFLVHEDLLLSLRNIALVVDLLVDMSLKSLFFETIIEVLS